MNGSAGTVRPGLPALPGDELSDRLSPVFVRELRRTLRTPFFVGGFVVLQAVALLGALLESGVATVLAAAGGGTMTFAGFLPSVTSLAFGFILPFAHFNSLRPELGVGRNGELLATAGLTAWQIAGGRVLAAASTGVVLFVSLLPYFLLRYFLGGIEPLALLHTSSVLLLTHVAMCAIVTGASVFASIVGRFVTIAGFAILFSAHQAPYRYGASGFFGTALPSLAALGELLVPVLFTIIGLQLGMSKLLRFERPLAPQDPGLILAFAFLVLPFVHFFSFGIGGVIGGVVALGLMCGAFYLLEPIPGRKKRLKPPPQSPPLPPA